jgi:hypothetical protein
MKIRLWYRLPCLPIPHPQTQEVAPAIGLGMILERSPAMQYESVVDKLHVSALHLKIHR